MDEFFAPRTEAMVPPFIQGAVRSNPPTEEANSLPKWMIGESSLEAEPGAIPEQDFGPTNIYASDVEPEYLLYYYPHSYHSQKVLMTLFEKDIPFKSRLVNINLGEQFHDDFLAICPKAEVPVLRNLKDKTTHVDSTQIMEYLEEQDNGKLRVRKLVPEVEPWKATHAEFLKKLGCLRVDALTFGSAYFGKFCRLQPHYPYNYTPVRLQLQEIALQRVNVLRHEAERVASTMPEAASYLNQKAEEAEIEGPIMRDIREFERIVMSFENAMDECEAQLQRNWIDENNPEHWLICPFITQADILLGLILHRLWQLGFGERIFSPIRPQIKIYYKRMKKVFSYTQSVPLEAETNYWPFLIGAAGLVLLLFIEGIWRRSR